MVRRKNDTVGNILRAVPLNISFRRPIVGHKLLAWNELLLRIANVQLIAQIDVFRWNLNKSGIFSVQSFYAALITSSQISVMNHFWKIKIPLKVKIFLWYLEKGVVLTKDNLFKRNWRGSNKCCFCINEETIQHLFIECPFARLAWWAVQCAFNLSPPLSIENLFGNWLNGIPKLLKSQLLVGASALCWSIWLCRNDAVFNKNR